MLALFRRWLLTWAGRIFVANSIFGIVAVCRPQGRGNSFIRELIMPFGSWGYVALSEIVDSKAVVIGAILAAAGRRMPLRAVAVIVATAP